MKKYCFLLLFPLYCFSDPGITIEAEVIVDWPEKPGEPVIGCK